MYKIPLMIRQIKYRIKDNMPRMYLLSLYHLYSDNKGDVCILYRQKGAGMEQVKLDKHELALVKFLKANYGLGEYSIVRCVGGKRGFRLFWWGIIEKDRFIRNKGKMSPYMLSLSPVKSWHSLDSIKKDEWITCLFIRNN